MTTTAPPPVRATGLSDDARARLEALLPEVSAAVRATGSALLDRFDAAARPTTWDELTAAVRANDVAALRVLRPRLEALRPGAGWADDEAEGSLPPGEWWVADAVEGNVNHVHGSPGWGVTAALVRDGAVVLSVVHLPLAATVATAVARGGAHQDGAPLRVSAKTDLRAALVSTGQAAPGEDGATLARLGGSVSAMLRAALMTRVSVPSTLHLLDVAAGRADAFWQHSAVRSGLAAGALLVAEAGGTVTDLRGEPWTLGSADLLAAAPGVHAVTLSTLAGPAASR